MGRKIGSRNKPKSKHGSESHGAYRTLRRKEFGQLTGLEKKLLREFLSLPHITVDQRFQIQNYLGANSILRQIEDWLRRPEVNTFWIEGNKLQFQPALDLYMKFLRLASELARELSIIPKGQFAIDRTTERDEELRKIEAKIKEDPDLQTRALDLMKDLNSG